MSLVTVIIFLLIVGFILYLFGGRLDPTLRMIIIALIVLAIVFWVMDAAGLIHLPAAFRIQSSGR